jgi:hypothetical protein
LRIGKELTRERLLQVYVRARDLALLGESKLRLN